MVQAFGKADLASGDPMDLDDHFRIASITKTFTATAALRLVDQGKLRLDDTLSTYVAGIPNGDRITIRNLLGMTSGIYDFTMDEKFDRAFADNPLMSFGLGDVLAILRRHQPEFEPGAKVSYCDTNYWLLGVILEKVTGEPPAKVIAEEILRPLGLTETSYPETAAMPATLRPRLLRRRRRQGTVQGLYRNESAVAATAGAMISTLLDLHIWAKVLATGALLTPAAHAEQVNFGAIPTPGGISVGYGLGIMSLGGFVGHNGAILGYTTAMLYLPEADATIVVEGNQSSNFSNATTDIAVKLAQYLFPERFRK